MMSSYLKAVAVLLLLLLAVLVRGAEGDAWKISLKDADIREFVAQVAGITGKSYVVDPRVKGKVTVVANTAMDKAGVSELFHNVLRVHGFAAVPSGNVIRVVQQVLAKQSSNPKDFMHSRDSEEIVTAVLPVRNSPSIELVKILRPLIPQYSHIAGIHSPNALIISDHAENIARLEEIVRRIDVADNLAVQIVDLKEAWVEDIVGLLKELAPDQIGAGATGPNRVTIVASERTNSLVLRGERDTVAKVLALIDRLDVAANRSGSTQVIRLAHADAEELAELLKNIVGGNLQEGAAPGIEVNIQPDTAINALVIRADPSTMLEIKDIIQSLDVRRLQVLIEAAIVEVTSDFTKDLGSELFVGDASSGNLPLGITAPAGTIANVLQNLALDTPAPVDLGSQPLIAGGRLNREGTSFGLILRALTTNRDVNLLSTPSITTMQNQKAKIVVGQNVPFRTGSTLVGSSGASNPFTTIQRQDVGLTLEVTPHIQDSGLLRLIIHQEVSEVDVGSLTAIGSDGSADLITNKRTIDTTVVVDDQEVIIIGGLIRDKETKVKTRVPFLGSIPVLGLLFRSTSTNVEKQNLLVFLRPTILKSRKAIAEVTEREFNNVYEVQIQGKDPADAISELFNGKAPSKK